MGASAGSLLPGALGDQFVGLSPPAVCAAAKRISVEMNAKRSSREVQDRGCRAVSALVCQYKEDGARAALEAGCMKSVVAAVGQHPDDTLIQTSGCFALKQMLALSPAVTQSSPRDADVAHTITAALLRAPKALNIQREGCAALTQYLAKGGESAARTCVRAGAPGALVAALRENSTEVSVLQVACDAIAHMLASGDVLACRIIIDAGVVRALAATLRENHAANAVCERALPALLCLVDCGEVDVVRSSCSARMLRKLKRCPHLSNETRRSAKVLIAQLKEGEADPSGSLQRVGLRRWGSRSRCGSASGSSVGVHDCNDDSRSRSSSGFDFSDGEASESELSEDATTCGGSSGEAVIKSASSSTSAPGSIGRPEGAFGRLALGSSRRAGSFGRNASSLVKVKETSCSLRRRPSDPRLQSAFDDELPMHAVTFEESSVDDYTGVVHYTMQVSDGQRSWTVKHRYKEFRLLARRIGRLSHLPRRTFIPVMRLELCCSKNVREQRHRGLGDFVRAVVESDPRLETPALRKFFEVPARPAQTRLRSPARSAPGSFGSLRTRSRSNSPLRAEEEGSTVFPLAGMEKQHLPIPKLMNAFQDLAVARMNQAHGICFEDGAVEKSECSFKFRDPRSAPSSMPSEEALPEADLVSTGEAERDTCFRTPQTSIQDRTPTRSITETALEQGELMAAMSPP